MIKIHLSKILGEKRLTQKDLCKMTGIRAATVNAYYNEYIKRFNKKDLDKICIALNCRLSDLIEHIPDKQ